MAGNEKIASPLNRAAVRTLSGKLVHDVHTVDHSFTSISELVWRKASVQFEVEGSVQVSLEIRSAVGNPDRPRESPPR